MPADFEPYPELPEDTGMSPEGLSVQRGNAMWAKRFEGGTTNLAQRARHAQQIRDYAVSYEDARRQAQAERIANDRDAANFFLRSRALDLTEKKAAFDMGDKIRKADAAEAMAESVFKAREAATTASIANTERLTKEAELKSRIQTDADLFQAKVAQAAMLYDKDEDFDRAVLGARSEHRLAIRDPDAKTVIDSAQKGYDRRTAEAVAAAKAAALKMVPDKITATGATTWEMAPTPPIPPRNPELTSLKSSLGKMEADQIAADTDAERMEMEPKLKLLREKIASLEGGSLAPAASAPADKPKAVKQNGVIYRLQPDGSYK